jgi:hypothetical protein
MSHSSSVASRAAGAAALARGKKGEHNLGAKQEVPLTDSAKEFSSSSSSSVGGGGGARNSVGGGGHSSRVQLDEGASPWMSKLRSTPAKDKHANDDPNDFGPSAAGKKTKNNDPNFAPRSTATGGPSEFYRHPDANQYREEGDSSKCPQQKWGEWESEQNLHGEQIKRNLRNRFDEYQQKFSDGKSGGTGGGVGGGRTWQKQHWGGGGGSRPDKPAGGGLYNQREEKSNIRTTPWGFSLYRHISSDVDLKTLPLQQQVEHRVGEWQEKKRLQGLLRTLPDIFPGMEAEADGEKSMAAGGDGDKMNQPSKKTNVKRQFMQAMRKIHPDKQPKDATEEQRLLAALLSSIVTEAYQNRDSASNTGPVF